MVFLFSDEEEHFSVDRLAVNPWSEEMSNVSEENLYKGAILSDLLHSHSYQHSFL